MFSLLLSLTNNFQEQFHHQTSSPSRIFCFINGKNKTKGKTQTLKPPKKSQNQKIKGSLQPLYKLSLKLSYFM